MHCAHASLAPPTPAHHPPTQYSCSAIYHLHSHANVRTRDETSRGMDWLAKYPHPGILIHTSGQWILHYDLQVWRTWEMILCLNRVSQYWSQQLQMYYSCRFLWIIICWLGSFIYCIAVAQCFCFPWLGNWVSFGHRKSQLEVMLDACWVIPSWFDYYFTTRPLWNTMILWTTRNRIS